jgi:glycine/D-amino acid oxidase-like deaminating enzyme
VGRETESQMRIGIIGAGHIGLAIATLAVRHGHKVMIGNFRGPETLAALAKELGCVAGTAGQAAICGEVVLIAIPLGGVAACRRSRLLGNTGRLRINQRARRIRRNATRMPMSTNSRHCAYNPIGFKWNCNCAAHDRRRTTSPQCAAHPGASIALPCSFDHLRAKLLQKLWVRCP